MLALDNLATEEDTERVEGLINKDTSIFDKDITYLSILTKRRLKLGYKASEF